jgi:histidyl-tRNA synthetase
MAKTDDEGASVRRPDARVAKGFRDIEAAELRQLEAMIATIRSVYERYGFEPLETPVFEYTDCLGKFLPDQDRPNAGVFSFPDEDEQWMSLRYDLTAPLARFVAQNFDRLPKPYRRFAVGSVYRNEKPGPGRYRQFTQFDADTVGTDNLAADAEICMLAADTLEALGIKRGDYVVKVSHRGLLDGVLEQIGVVGADAGERKLIVLRAIDKLDRLGVQGVRLLLGAGRKDESGDFTKGAGLATDQIEAVVAFLEHPVGLGSAVEATGSVGGFAPLMEIAAYAKGCSDLAEMRRLFAAAGYGCDQIKIDQTVVRGLEYYTGPVFEAELTFEVKDDKGHPVRFGSVGGGGRYDDLVARFTGQKVPATGFSIGVSRLQAALTALNKGEAKPALGPVIVLVMDKDQLPHYQGMAQMLRRAGVRAEMYLGTAGMKPQMKYADKRGAAVVVIQGSNERETGDVVLKDLIEGAKAAAEFKNNKDYKASRPAQISVKEADLVTEVRAILARYE